MNTFRHNDSKVKMSLKTPIFKPMVQTKTKPRIPIGYFRKIPETAS